VFARIRLDLCAIDGYLPQLHQSGLLAQLQCLHKQFTQLVQMLFPKIRYGVVIRMLVRRQIAERHVLKGLPLDGSRTSYSHAIAVLFYRWDWEGAEKESERAIELNPSLAEGHHLHAYILETRNHTEEALQEDKLTLSWIPSRVRGRTDMR
jgi:tetratricopeptide (TPR) repeat protein